MRHTGVQSLALVAALLLVGCEKHTSSTPATNSKVSIAKEKIGEAVDATIAAAKEKRDEYAREMNKQMDELNVKYEELRVRAAKAEGQVKTDLEKKLEEAKVKRDVASKKLDELKQAGADRWEKVKEGVGNALNDLKKVFE
jgi:TolA-binding protein